MFGYFDKEYQMELLKKAEREEEKLSSIRSLMETMKWTAQQAMDALKISSDEQQKYLALI